MIGKPKAIALAVIALITAMVPTLASAGANQTAESRTDAPTPLLPGDTSVPFWPHETGVLVGTSETFADMHEDGSYYDPSLGRRVLPDDIGRAKTSAAVEGGLEPFATGVTSPLSVAIATRPSTWSGAVSGICSHALLFEGSHQMGTRAGAVAVARDIRASTARRLRRIRALQIVPPDGRLSTRWLNLERRLAAVYASSYLRIYDAIAAAETPRQQARLPLVLARLLHSPDALRAIAQSLEQRLHVPDCTGGATPHGSGPAAVPSGKE